VYVGLHVDPSRVLELERVLYSVSDPHTSSYGQHLSRERIAALLDVPPERSQNVLKFFREAGALNATVSPTRDGVHVIMKVAALERALRAALFVYRHERTGRTITRCTGSYSVPAALRRDLRVVSGLTNFPLPRRLERRLERAVVGIPSSCSASASCGTFITPGLLAQQYQVTAADSAADQVNNTMAVAEFQQEWFKQSDLDLFSKECGRNVSVSRIVGSIKPIAGDECSLDLEYMGSVAPRVPMALVYQDDFDLLQWSEVIAGLDEPPLVHSVSWAEDEIQVTEAYRDSCNLAFMKAGARGLSIFFASGDYGVCGDEGCETLVHGHETVFYKPMFPASSPYVTAVGATDLVGDSVGEEMAWQRSGGGFSATFTMPAYQATAVAAYKAAPAANLPDPARWNQTGRGFPDLSALGGKKNPYCVYAGGEWGGIAGTSASSPVVGGVFALLNGLRTQAGKPSLGFVNPMIYAHPAAFHDVTSGCNTNGFRYGGFTAISGWDPATGVGTPNYEALKAIVLQLP
jgi:tripeptidyl-peptidase-1